MPSGHGQASVSEPKGRRAIGHDNTPKPAPPPDYKAAATPAPVQTELQDQALKALKWGAKGDYTDPHDAGVFINYADPAMLNRHNELITNEASQGTSALGTPDTNALAAVKENTKAHMAEDAAGKYEGDIKAGIGAATGVAENMSNLSADDRRAILSSQTGVYNTWQSRPQQPPWWNALISGGAAGAAAAI